MASNKKKIMTVISLIVLFVVVLGAVYFLMTKDPCRKIKDSSSRADCYIELAKTEQSIKYCAVNYETVKCLEVADPLHQASKVDVDALCDLITDSSQKTECREYVEENYKNTTLENNH